MVDKEASQTRGLCVAQSATHRAARPDPHSTPLRFTQGSLRAGSRGAR